MKRTTLTLALLLPTALVAQETRDLDAHEHGHSALNIAIEGNDLAMELEAPGADIVGFEYVASTDADRAKIAAAIAMLSDPLSLFVLPAAAGCTVVSVEAALEGADKDHDHDDHAEHKEDKDHAGHDHDDHAHDDHGHEEHGHEDHAEDKSAVHSEFHAEYRLTCTDPSAIDGIGFAFFEVFPNAVEIDVQLVSDRGAQGLDVSRDAPQLDLSGLI